MPPEEFKSRILPLQAGLYRFAKSLLNHREEAEDCVQEVMMKLWTKRKILAGVVNLKAYCFQIARNRCLDILKSKKMDLKEIDTGMASGIDIYSQTELADRISIVHSIVSRLPEPQRTVVHLRNIEEWDMKEIAEVTGMTIEHTRVTLSRARQSIRQTYQKLYGHE